MIHGLGRYTWPDGRSYEGEYVNDQKQGYGIYSWPDGQVYRGAWEDGVQHGLGTYSFQDKDKKEKVKYG
jgi:hypothetical protein